MAHLDSDHKNFFTQGWTPLHHHTIIEAKYNDMTVCSLTSSLLTKRLAVIRLGRGQFLQSKTVPRIPFRGLRACKQSLGSSPNPHSSLCFSTTHEPSNDGTGINPTMDWKIHWKSVKDQVLSAPQGSLDGKKWQLAKQLMDQLRLDHSHVQHNSDRIGLIFEIMDRLSQEARSHAFTLDDRVRISKGDFTALLVAWRDDVFASAKKFKEDPDALAVSLKLGPMQMVVKIRDYLESGLIMPNPNYYNIVFHAIPTVMRSKPRIYATSQNERNDSMPHQAHELFERMQKESKHNPHDLVYHPTAATVYGLIEIWANSDMPVAPGRAESYLKRLQSWYQLTHREDMFPMPSIYCAVMEAHSRCSAPTKAFESIQRLYDEMMDRCSDEVGSVMLNKKHFTRVCNALSNCSHEASAASAAAILDFMIDSNKPEWQPDQYTYSAVLNGYARAGRADDALQLFKKLEESQLEEPDIICYSNLIWAQAKAGNRAEAENILSKMMDAMDKDKAISETQDPEVIKDFMSGWNALLASWTESREMGSDDSIRMIIDRLQKEAESRNWPQVVTGYTYNMLLSSMARQGKGDKVEEIFDWMDQQENNRLRPDRDTYLNVLLAWCTSGDMEKAHLRLKQFCQLIKDGSLHPPILEAQHFTIVIEGWASTNHPQKVEKAMETFELMDSVNIQPNVVTYTCLLWILAKREDGGDPGLSSLPLFQKMEDEWQSGNEHARPNSITYNALLYGLSHSSSPNALQIAEQYFEEMRNNGLKHNVILYNTLMSAWAKQKRPDKTESLFHEMKHRYESENEVDLQPNSSVFRTRLLAWSQVGNPEQTTIVLKEWIQAYDNGLLDAKPREREFGAVLQAWLRSRKPEAAGKAENGLRQMMEYARSGRFDCFPSVFSFTSVITAFSKSRQKDAGHRALSLFYTLQDLERESYSSKKNYSSPSNMRPNLLTYSSVISAILNSLSSGLQNNEDYASLEQALGNILAQLEEKEDYFWNEFHSGKVIQKITREISRNPLPQQASYLESCRRIKQIAVAQGQASAKSSQRRFRRKK